MSDFTNEEPSAIMRDMARTLRDMYVALRKEGFTEPEAVAVIGQVLVSSQQGNQ